LCITTRVIGGLTGRLTFELIQKFSNLSDRSVSVVHP